MTSLLRQWAGLLALCASLLGWGTAHALTPQAALAMAEGDTDARIAAIQQAAAEGGEQLTAFLDALEAGDVRVWNGAAWMVQPDGTLRQAVTGETAPMDDAAEEPMINNRLRGAIGAARSALSLFAADVQVRRAAASDMLSKVEPAQRALIEQALAKEKDGPVRTALQQVRAAILLQDDHPAERKEAAAVLGESGAPDVRRILNDRLATETDPAVQAQLKRSLAQVNDRLAWGERLGTLFTGVSLGSILLLVALGLAVTYGLMGVINMAHGELMMIGAYATYVTQMVFRQYFPGAFDAYLLAAIPLSFLVAALVGAVMERTVLRFLYGRPLETLLATWGISLVLMQLVRSIFGAQNVGVENPSWMSGGLQVLPNLTLPWNRMLIIVFAAVVLAAMAWVIGRTRLGLFVRGVTQNRTTASCMGVNTARVDTMAFALGSGIAGLAGCALSQVGNVGPDLGQSYIVDAFMVVVTGGVGQLMGTVYAALGLGVINKFLEGWAGAVLAKIAVLVFIIIFIQKRPQGIFAVKGRSAEA